MFEINLLRSFLAVADARSFTLAAARLGLSQPTVSQHVRRLEVLTGEALLSRDTHAVALTPDGAVLARFAREIVALDAQASAYYAGAADHWRVRLGVSEDLALTRLPGVLRKLSEGRSKVQIDLTVGLTSMLYPKLDSGRRDLILATRRVGDDRGVVVRSEPLVWMAHRGLRLQPHEPVPLVMYPSGSITSSLAVEALEGAGLAWRMACSSETLSGVWSGLQAGLGVSAQSKVLQDLPPGELVTLGAEAGLPGLGSVEFVLLGRSRRLTEPVAAVAALMEQAAQELWA